MSLVWSVVRHWICIRRPLLRKTSTRTCSHHTCTSCGVMVVMVVVTFCAELKNPINCWLLEIGGIWLICTKLIERDWWRKHRLQKFLKSFPPFVQLQALGFLHVNGTHLIICERKHLLWRKGNRSQYFRKIRFELFGVSFEKFTSIGTFSEKSRSWLYLKLQWKTPLINTLNP